MVVLSEEDKINLGVNGEFTRYACFADEDELTEEQKKCRAAVCQGRGALRQWKC